MEAVKRRCCPVCGGKIVVSALYQTSHDYEVTKRGTLSKRFTREGEHSLEVTVAGCRNHCGAYWDADSFYIDENYCFWDEKYIDL